MKSAIYCAIASLAVAGMCPAASTVLAYYQMGELEYNGGLGTANGATAGTLLATTGANMAVLPSTTPTLVVGTGASNTFGSAGGSTAYMSFDGTTESYSVSTNVLASANSSGTWMMEAWVRPTIDALDTTLNLFMTNGNGGTGVCLNYNAQANRYGIFFGGSGGVNGSIGATVGTWDHVALVYDTSLPSGQQMTLYVNGQSAWTGNKQGTAGYANGNGIGNQLGGGTNGFRGDIDDVYFSSISNFTTADFHVVPEPSAALLSGLGALALLRRRRN